MLHYGHNNQSIGHQWGGNFKEFIAIADTIKAGILLMQNYCRYSRLDFDTADDRLIMVGIFIKIMMKIDHLMV
jgi:hypothetical protein